jgi:ATP-binding cassette subfamily B protein
MSVTDNLQSYTWPISKLDEALIALAQKSGFLSDLPDSKFTQPTIKKGTNESDVLNNWIEAAASWLGIEAEEVSTPYGEIQQLLRLSGPALFHLRVQDEESRLLLLLKRGWRGAAIVTPDGEVIRVKPSEIRAAWCYDLEAPLLPEIEEFLAEMGLEKKRWPDASVAFLQERLRHHKIGGCWLLRLPPNAPFMTLARHARLPLYLAISIVGEAINSLILYGVMGLIGLTTLGGRLAWAWLLAGLLMLLTAMPIVSFKFWVEKIFAVEFGKLLKKRLFYGVLRLDPDEVQLQGEGQFLGWVMDSERLEQTSTRALPAVLGAWVSLLITVLVLMLGAGGLYHGLLLLSWLAFSAVVSWRAVQTYFIQSEYYSQITTDLVEKLEGHHTRLVQEQDWYSHEDQTLNHYLNLSHKDDINRTLLLVVVPYGWLVIGLLGLVHTFLSQPSDAEALGITILGSLMAFNFLQLLAWNMSDIARAVAAWQLIQPLYQAATREPPKGSKNLILKAPAKGQLILDTHNLVFRYQPRSRPILANCNLQIYSGDRILLEGPSGGGKSTLASLLIGLHSAQSGLLLLRGMDQYTLGPQAWRQQVVAAPQFHENHVLNATFAFNLLMGRYKSPTEEDFAEAETVCRELGLGELIDRMPKGLNQIVGEQGWRLSHGEQSRLYIARALLQEANLIILDESFGALDPKSLQIALHCVLKRAPTLLVIAHP